MTPEEEKSGLHATTVQLQGRGVMLMGKSGAGKTELALTLVERAIARNEQASLVADDRTLLHAESGKLIARVPQTLAGGVEIRGAGLFTVAYVEQTPLDLVVRLVDRDGAERYPSGENWHFEGVEVPCLLLPALSSNGDSNALSRAIEATLFLKPWP
ncbi:MULTISPECIES: HPr kinase/phosphorylase [Ochrobactrum]|jgi:serine kinase of HPr protein (carbohydrate metabolism regulator)|uniref:HPr Serine kinase C-terminal domain protein n=1 Tax=Ochrobactrum quorumnocens TaxID=271865 RepID=A0A248ULA0_9HYPH|nr:MULTISPECIES: ATP-binding protein [Brucella/Ochrobactrum group]ASV87448.1 HPr Serine kinase C-terminal domain protein [[Ochrobactrum] quorumnocens]KAA9369320.1 HPr kinase/phosphorylase [[Ochrobactrum] quorumnocens]MBD7991224.1 HPr kinase/phosphorylase [Ochrobactrum gallinarum]MDH7790262.1 serine kinase of HPr protein (carbohydrate metabolism regulator) [Ochrobactrum sp. AN78]